MKFVRVRRAAFWLVCKTVPQIASIVAPYPTKAALYPGHNQQNALRSPEDTWGKSPDASAGMPLLMAFTITITAGCVESKGMGLINKPAGFDGLDHHDQCQLQPEVGREGRLSSGAIEAAATAAPSASFICRGTAPTLHQHRNLMATHVTNCS